MKPYVILSAAMTLDGKIATETGSSEISNQKDLIRVHKLRREVDAIMVGIGTVLKDNPKLTAHKVSDKKEDNPIRIIIDSTAKTPLNSKVLNNQAKTIIATNKNAKTEKIEKKAEIYKTNSTDKVDLKELLNYLGNIGIKTIMLEGGSTLNYSLFKENLIDEIQLCIAPLIVGGVNAKTLVDGEGIKEMKNAIKLEFKDSYFIEEDLILTYNVLNTVNP